MKFNLIFYVKNWLSKGMKVPFLFFLSFFYFIPSGNITSFPFCYFTLKKKFERSKSRKSRNRNEERNVFIIGANERKQLITINDSEKKPNCNIK